MTTYTHIFCTIYSHILSYIFVLFITVFIYSESSRSHSAHSVHFRFGRHIGATSHDAGPLQELSEHVQTHTSSRGWHT